MAGSQNDNPFDAPIGQLNNLKSPDVQKVVTDDLYSVLGGSASESLKPKDVLGAGDKVGKVIGILETHFSLKDRELNETGTREEPEDEEGESRAINNGSSAPYGYIVNIPELVGMLPKIPSDINSSRWDKIVRAYRDNGFVFRCRPNHSSELANVGDTVKVNFTNSDNYSSGYYVGLISRAGDHPGVIRRERDREPLEETVGRLSTPTYTGGKATYQALVEDAKEEVKPLKCCPDVAISTKYYAGEGGRFLKRQKDFGGHGWPTAGTDGDGENIGMFITNNPDRYGDGKARVNKKVVNAFMLARHLMAQDPEILRYFAETLIIYPDYATVGRKYARISSLRRMCFADRISKNAACWPGCTHKLTPGGDKMDGRCIDSAGKGCRTPGGYWKDPKNKCAHGYLGHHGIGLAIDFNPGTNPYSHDFKTDHPPKLQAIMEQCGFRKGTDFGKSDTQHFDFVGDIKEVNEQWERCKADPEFKDYYVDNWESVNARTSPESFLSTLASAGIETADGPVTLESKVLDSLMSGGDGTGGGST